MSNEPTSYLLININDYNIAIKNTEIKSVISTEMFYSLKKSITSQDEEYIIFNLFKVLDGIGDSSRGVSYLFNGIKKGFFIGESTNFVQVKNVKFLNNSGIPKVETFFEYNSKLYSVMENSALLDIFKHNIINYPSS